MCGMGLYGCYQGMDVRVAKMEYGWRRIGVCCQGVCCQGGWVGDGWRIGVCCQGGGWGGGWVGEGW